MATRMLIDGRHQEETRVAVVKNNRIEEFDFESAEHRQIKGNIYLAKVTRVEPSLQAAFVDFGGNRHGFLAFSEIHPDYYQIPREDREKLLAEEAEAAEEEARLRAEEEESGEIPGEEYDAIEEDSGDALAEDLAEDGVEEIDTTEKDEISIIEEGVLDNETNDEILVADETDDLDPDAEKSEELTTRRRRRRQGRKGNTSRAKEVDEVRAKRQALRRRYKIQDVIQRRQVLLVQVVKEERGNKGAALTTYLSLAGRYTVLMPNSSHGGGISRKINSATDRKRLKQIVADLTLPKTMGLIVRTAGLSRTKTEIKRDFDYLARLWDEIRQKTLSSSAPSLIHSDSDLIKRAIRDIYNRDILEVIVEGDQSYKLAKQFMKLLMPSHARRVKIYSDPVPLFQRYGTEDQLRAMYDPVAQLKSGGYLVINPTEALVSIDINSGRSTKQHGIEQTAVATNIEAAREIARQLRLRDMAGLVVIDFIDMEYNSNIRKVEKAMKEALKNDRARIQVGRISSFGLMEMSRQRLRTGVLEATTRECPHCDGSGLVRTASSAGLSALRLIEDEAAKGKGTIIRLAASTEAAVYLLNSKRNELIEIEKRYSVTIQVSPEGEDEGAKMVVTSSGPRPTSQPTFKPIIDDETDESTFHNEADEDDEDTPNKKRRRRRRGGRGRNKKRHEADNDEAPEQVESNDNQASVTEASQTKNEQDAESDRKPKRRAKVAKPKAVQNGGGKEKEEILEKQSSETEPMEQQQQTDAEIKKKSVRKKATRKKSDQTASIDLDSELAEKPKRKKASPKKKVQVSEGEPKESSEPTKRKRSATKAKILDEPAVPATKGTKETGNTAKKGWWQKTFGD